LLFLVFIVLEGVKVARTSGPGQTWALAALVSLLGLFLNEVTFEAMLKKCGGKRPYLACYNSNIYNRTNMMQIVDNVTNLLYKRTSRQRSCLCHASVVSPGRPFSSSSSYSNCNGHCWEEG
jgi:hypothetical protein